MEPKDSLPCSQKPASGTIVQKYFWKLFFLHAFSTFPKFVSDSPTFYTLNCSLILYSSFNLDNSICCWSQKTDLCIWNEQTLK